MNRRAFISLLGGAAAWPMAARAQQATMPVIGFLHAGTPETAARSVAAFRMGLGETGYVDGRNITIEYYWLEGRYDRLPAVLTDLVSRRVAVIATSGSLPAALAAKAATSTIPIVFAVGDDPVKLGLVASLARPGGNATGINFFVNEIVAKRLTLLHDMVPKAVRIGVIVNPANPQTEIALKELDSAARAIGLAIHIANAGTIREIDAAFEMIVREHADALFLAPDQFLGSRRVQIVTLATRHALPSSYSGRSIVEVGGLMSYGTNTDDAYRQEGVYTGRILKGEKPTDLPVIQSTRLEFIINLSTARALGIDISPTLIALADEVIE
jgi:putative ABC transport system substrate-binding protein